MRGAAGLSLLLVLAAVSTQRADAAEALPPTVASALQQAQLPANAAAVVVAPVDGQGTVRVNWNGSVAMNPASTMKLVTTYGALNLLGPAFSWQTQVFADGPLERDVLTGNVVIRGGGDPKIVIEDLWLLAYRMRAYGIREIRGDIMLDKSLFARFADDPDAFDGAGDRAYNVGPDALLLNFKALAFHFVPDPVANEARVVVVPPVAGMQIAPIVRGAGGGCGDWRGKLRADFSTPLAPRFSGSYPLVCGERVWYLGALDHEQYFAAVFRGLWESIGGSWRGVVKLGPVPASARLIAEHESQPLALMVRDINKFSNNVMARHLLLTIGSRSDVGGPRPATPEQGSVALRGWLGRMGLDSPELVLDNGAGLSRTARISAAALNRLLVHAYRSPVMPEFVASLPITGVDGTMKDRPVARGWAHLKTGSLSNVRAMAGYVTARSGKTYALVCFLNHANADTRSAQNAQDKLVDWLFNNG